MYWRIILASLITLGAIGSWVTDAPADSVRKSITPHLILNAQYDSNFYKTPNDEEGVWTYSIQPGIEAEIETEKSYASLYYTLDGYSYGSLDENLDYIGHTFKFDTGTRTRSDKLHFYLRDTFYRTRDPAKQDYLNDYVSTYEYSINRFSPEATYDFGRSIFRIAYDNVLLNYTDADTGTDSTGNRGTAEWKYRLDRANALGLNYQYGSVNYDGPESDYTSQQAKVVFDRQGKMLLLEAGGGWQSRKFDDPLLEDISNFVWNLMLQTKGLKKTSLTFSADGNLNYWDSGSGYYDATKLTLTADRNFAADFRGGLYCSYQKSAYETSDRDDNTWNLEGSLGYTVTRWLAVAGALGLETRSSNLDAAEYDDVYGIVTLSLIYPIGTGSPVITPSHYERF